MDKNAIIGSVEENNDIVAADTKVEDTETKPEKKKRGNKNFTSDQDKAKASENGRKGGIKSGEVRRSKKQMKERLNELFDMAVAKCNVEDFEDIIEIGESEGFNVSVQDAILIAQIQMAMKGNTKAAVFLRDTAGMKPVEKQEVKTEVTSSGKLCDILAELQKPD